MGLRQRKGGVFVRKPLELESEDDTGESMDSNATYTDLERNMTLWDLMVIGVGGTVGSGVFIVSGLIVADYAGTAAVLSWMLAGIGCMFSAASYTELSGHVPVEGGAYAYSYHTLGELPAVIVAWLLTLEYGLSGSAVARSWGTRLVHFLSGATEGGIHLIPASYSYVEYIFSAVLMSVCVAITAAGMGVSKKVASVLTVAKLLLVTFMIVMAYVLWNAENIKPFAPYGVKGVITGATASFFSYIGFDEPCMFAGEVKNPKRNIPIAMLGTVGFSTIIYLIAVFSLSGLAPYDELNPDGAFASGFHDRGYQWAGNLVATGEIITLPIVVLICMLAQPRLLYIMSVDGLFPKYLGGSIVRASLLAGTVCVAVATFVPFHILDITESAGVLLAYNFTHAGIFSKRYTSWVQQQGNGKQLTGLENTFWKFFRLNAGQFTVNERSIVVNAMLLIGLTMILRGRELWFGFVWFGTAMLAVSVIVLASFRRCCTLLQIDHEKESFFLIPNWLMPWAPAIGTFFNSVLIAQADYIGLAILLGIIVAAFAHYYLYAHRNSVLGHMNSLTRSRTRKLSVGQKTTEQAAI
eukprot:461286_1